MNLKNYVDSRPLNEYDLHFVDKTTGQYININAKDLERFKFIQEKHLVYDTFNHRLKATVVVEQIS